MLSRERIVGDERPSIPPSIPSPCLVCPAYAVLLPVSVRRQYAPSSCPLPLPLSVYAVYAPLMLLRPPPSPYGVR